MDWQPIKKAPKDGKKFIAYENGNIFMCSWYKFSKTKGHWQDPDDGSPVAQMFDEYHPTHWMPLPKPPKK